MTISVRDVYAKYGGVELHLVTSAGNRFFAKITSDGISSYSDESSSGTLLGEPIMRSVDELFEWIGSEGKKKPFRERKQVRVRRNLTSNPT